MGKKETNLTESECLQHKYQLQVVLVSVIAAGINTHKLQVLQHNC